MYLRLWSEGKSGRADAASDFDIALGQDHGRAAMLSLDRLCSLCAHQGRRPLVRHGLGCACLGADENCFAQMIAAASEGAREDAMMMASLIVRPDFAPALASLSEELGLALRRMTAAVLMPTTGHEVPSAVLH
jgi:predicted amidophosphoribosyltransferase